MKPAKNLETQEKDSYIGQQIKFARTLKEMSQTDLGIKLGISAAQIGKYESGQSTVSIEKLKGICDALDISIESVLSKNQTLDEHPFFAAAIKDNSKYASEEEIYELVTKFVKIKNADSRKTILEILNLVKTNA